MRLCGQNLLFTTIHRHIEGKFSEIHSQEIPIRVALKEERKDGSEDATLGKVEIPLTGLPICDGSRQLIARFKVTEHTANPKNPGYTLYEVFVTNYRPRSNAALSFWAKRRWLLLEDWVATT